MKAAKKPKSDTSIAVLQELVGRAQLLSVEVARLIVERKFAGASDVATPMPGVLDISTTFELFSPTTNQRDAAAFLVSLKTRWVAKDDPRNEAANAWVAFRMGYSFADQQDELTPATLRAFGEAVVRPQGWPFLRERIFTISQLAGLPPPILPLIALKVAPQSPDRIER